jgi:serine/threonine protein kinase
VNSAEEVAAAASSYEVLARLATGGMAEIFLARGASVGGVERHVVLKRILREKAADEQFVTMFLDEARLAAQLQHPNIAQVYDVGRLGDSFFFTMEYVHGDALRTLLRQARKRGVAIPIGAVLAIAAGTAAGLHHAHTRHGVDGSPLNIVHRDVSPSNVMVSFEGNVKVVDFGVAKAAHRKQETHSGTVKGKIAYLSPEQCRGVGVDQRSDLFSLGIVLWETIAGTRLFRRKSDFDTMHAIVNDPMPSLTQRRPDVPEPLEALVARLLEKDPRARFQSAEDLNEEIDRIAVAAGISMSPSVLARLMRELFGQRREPWVRLREPSQAPPVVTEEISKQLIVSVDPIDRALAQVVDLGSERAPRMTATVPAVSSRFPTIRLDPRGNGLVVTGDTAVPSPTAAGPSAPQFTDVTVPAARAAVASAPRITDGITIPAARAAVAPAPRITDVSLPVTRAAVASAHRVTDGTLPATRAAVASAHRVTDGITVLATRAAVASVPDALEARVVAPASSPRRVITRATIALVVVGAAAGITFTAMHSSGDSHRDVPSPPVASVVSEPPASPPRPVAAHITLPDPPASPPAPVVAPSGSGALTLRADAPVTRRPQPPELSATRCMYEPALVAKQPDACIVAACRARDVESARNWLRQAKHKRTDLDACRSAGVALEVREPPDNDACTDPYACQH